MRKRLAASVLLVLHLLATPAHAWDAVGHQVVARIAWEAMTPRARAAAAALLSNAPADSDLADLVPSAGSAAARDRGFFVQASTWPDVVRSGADPRRRDRYHRPAWHFVNSFFETTPAGPRDRTDLAADTTDVVRRLGELERSVADLRRPRGEAAVDLAWILHLVGDVHQPLHTAARVTRSAPRGDQGGNLFRLDGSNTLHGYWDGIVRAGMPRRSGESEAAYVERVAAAIMQRQPRGPLAGALRPGEYGEWAREGFAVAKSQVYATPEGRAPSEAYRRQAWATSERALALAGYRLADLLDRTLGGRR